MDVAGCLCVCSRRTCEGDVILALWKILKISGSKLNIKVIGWRLRSHGKLDSNHLLLFVQAIDDAKFDRPKDVTMTSSLWGQW